MHQEVGFGKTRVPRLRVQIQTGKGVVFCFSTFSLCVTRYCLRCFQNVRDLSAKARPLAEHPPQKKKRQQKNKSTSHNQKSLILEFPFCGRGPAVGKQDQGGYERQMSLGLYVFKEEWNETSSTLPTGMTQRRCHASSLCLKKLCLSARGVALQVGVRQGLASALIGLSDELPLRAVVRA